MKRLATFIFLAATIILHAQDADFIVAQDGSGNFRTVQEAINAVPDFRKNQTVIRIKAGVYKEKVTVPPTNQSADYRGICNNDHPDI